MLKTSFLGVVDCFQESLVAGQHFVRPVFPNLALAQPPANTSGNADGAAAAGIEPDVLSEFVRLNALDAELVSRARAEVRRRLSLVPDGHERLRQLKDASAARTSA
jgi:hypothetical protein